jgi:hypothetical protein
VTDLTRKEELKSSCGKGVYQLQLSETGSSITAAEPDNNKPLILQSIKVNENRQQSSLSSLDPSLSPRSLVYEGSQNDCLETREDKNNTTEEYYIERLDDDFQRLDNHSKGLHNYLEELHDQQSIYTSV